MSIETNLLQETMAYIVRLFQIALAPKVFKFIGAGIYIAFSFMFDVGMANGLIALFLLMLTDFITGYSAAKMTGEAIRSSKIRHSAIKVVVYYAMIASGHLVEMGLPALIHYIDETVLAFLMVTEFVSLLENMGKMGYETPKKLINQLNEWKAKQ